MEEDATVFSTRGTTPMTVSMTVYTMQMFKLSNDGTITSGLNGALSWVAETWKMGMKCLSDTGRITGVTYVTSTPYQRRPD